MCPMLGPMDVDTFLTRKFHVKNRFGLDCCRNAMKKDRFSKHNFILKRNKIKKFLQIFMDQITVNYIKTQYS